MNAVNYIIQHMTLIYQNEEKMKVKCTYSEIENYNIGEVVLVHKSHLKKNDRIIKK